MTVENRSGLYVGSFCRGKVFESEILSYVLGIETDLYLREHSRFLRSGGMRLLNDTCLIKPAITHDKWL